MRRKSERTSSKKSKSSPEKKEEKPKRTRASRRKKQSTSSENESADEGSPERVEPQPEVKEVDPPKTPTKEVSPEESQDQVWHVKTPQGAGESGEITKLKICLARPPSTPERSERSPRSKRKHSRATSSSDTPSVEGVEEKRKTRHRSRKSNRGSNETERSSESHNEDQDKPELEIGDGDKVECETSQVEPKQDSQTEDTAVSTTEENTNDGSVQSVEPDDKPNEMEAKEDSESQQAEEDSTVTSSKEPQPEEKISVQQHKSEVDDDHSQESVDKSPEPTADDNKPEDVEMMEPKEKQSNAEETPARVPEQAEEVSKVEERAVPEEGASSSTEDVKATNDHDVLELEPSQSDRERKMSTDSHKEHEVDSHKRHRRREYDRSESTQSTNEETNHNGEVSAPIVVNRKRRWGSRPSKVKSQKSITISTDVLKDIIPDVKPVEFNEVIEEKKHPKRIDLTEKIERPVLPKIVIDNTEHVELKKDEDEKYDVKVRDREAHPMGNRRISIIKENDVTGRPPSPPRNVQSCILYITNLVRPFTLPQLKNLLQRTGRIAENGFWIDKIKSRCFVKYVNEEQAVETRHALHGVTWPVSNPKTLHVDFSTDDAFARAMNEETENVPTSTIPGTVEDWLREQDMKRERGDPVQEKPWERKLAMREWDVGKGKDEKQREERPPEKRRPRDMERSPEPVKKFKKKEEEAPAKLLDDLFRKTKTTPCIYWLPLSAETIAVKEEQRRQHMAEHERRMNELRRRRH